MFEFTLEEGQTVEWDSFEVADESVRARWIGGPWLPEELGPGDVVLETGEYRFELENRSVTPQPYELKLVVAENRPFGKGLVGFDTVHSGTLVNTPSTFLIERIELHAEENTAFILDWLGEEGNLDFRYRVIDDLGNLVHIGNGIDTFQLLSLEQAGKYDFELELRSSGQQDYQFILRDASSAVMLKGNEELEVEMPPFENRLLRYDATQPGDLILNVPEIDRYNLRRPGSSPCRIRGWHHGIGSCVFVLANQTGDNRATTIHPVNPAELEPVDVHSSTEVVLGDLPQFFSLPSIAEDQSLVVGLPQDLQSKVSVEVFTTTGYRSRQVNEGEFPPQFSLSADEEYLLKLTPVTTSGLEFDLTFTSGEPVSPPPASIEFTADLEVGYQNTIEFEGQRHEYTFTLTERTEVAFALERSFASLRLFDENGEIDLEQHRHASATVYSLQAGNYTIIFQATREAASYHFQLRNLANAEELEPGLTEGSLAEDELLRVLKVEPNAAELQLSSVSTEDALSDVFTYLPSAAKAEFLRTDFVPPTNAISYVLLVGASTHYALSLAPQQDAGVPSQDVVLGEPFQGTLSPKIPDRDLRFTLDRTETLLFELNRPTNTIVRLLTPSGTWLNIQASLSRQEALPSLAPGEYRLRLESTTDRERLFFGKVSSLSSVGALRLNENNPVLSDTVYKITVDSPTVISPQFSSEIEGGAYVEILTSTGKRLLVVDREFSLPAGEHWGVARFSPAAQTNSSDPIPFTIRFNATRRSEELVQLGTLEEVHLSEDGLDERVFEIPLPAGSRMMLSHLTRSETALVDFQIGANQNWLPIGAWQDYVSVSTASPLRVRVAGTGAVQFRFDDLNRSPTIPVHQAVSLTLEPGSNHAVWKLPNAPSILFEELVGEQVEWELVDHMGQKLSSVLPGQAISLVSQKPIFLKANLLDAALRLDLQVKLSASVNL